MAVVWWNAGIHKKDLDCLLCSLLVCEPGWQGANWSHSLRRSTLLNNIHIVLTGMAVVVGLWFVTEALGKCLAVLMIIV
jgi:hypothetical protein